MSVCVWVYDCAGKTVCHKCGTLVRPSRSFYRTEEKKKGGGGVSEVMGKKYVTLPPTYV